MHPSNTYLEIIKNSLEKFYTHDFALLDSKLHEMAFCFRLAFYLAQELEDQYKVVDCQYHALLNEGTEEEKAREERNQRPDISFHQRKTDKFPGNNILALEVKLGSPGDEIQKVRNMMYYLGYEYGFCISNIGQNYVTLYEILQGSPSLQKYRFRINNIGNDNMSFELMD